jgi:transposase
MSVLAGSVDAVIGVDTHRDTLAAAVVTPVGAVIAEQQVIASADGYRTLLEFGHAHVPGTRLVGGGRCRQLRRGAERLPHRAR